MKTFLRLTGALLSLCLCTHPIFAQTTLFVNEIMASNNTGITDATGAHEDWFEIYNPNNFAVDIAGYYLSDKTATPKKYQMPTGNAETVIQPNGFLRIWASEQVTRGPLHVGFALSASGENVVLSAPNGTLIDAVTFGAQTTDYSYGRTPDGTNNWSLYSIATPGATNAGGTTYQPKLAPPAFSHPAGFKTALFNLTLSHPDPTVTIRYTTDGSEPTLDNAPIVWKYKNSYNDTGARIGVPGVGQGLLEESNLSHVYNNPIPITDKATAPNRVSMKSSNFDFNVSYLPPNPIYKGTVIRAKAFKAGSIPSETITKTYFINLSGGSKYSIPLISLVSDERSFFDYNTGIYNAGIAFDQFRENSNAYASPCEAANYMGDGDDWERQGSFEFFENANSVFSQNIGFRIHGNCSRFSPQKSLRLYSDTKFDYPFFTEKPGAFYKRILMRTGGNELPTTAVRDLAAQKLLENLRFDTQSSRLAVLFINAEYWGIQPIRERYDRFYLETKYNVDKDNVDLIQTIIKYPDNPGYEVEEGDATAYQALLDYVFSHDLSVPANYETIKTMIDLESFIEYQVAQIYLRNYDWPRHNTRLWRTKTPNLNPGAPYAHDGRWRWMFFDGDFAMSTTESHNIDEATYSGDNPLPELFKKMLLNPEFKALFNNRIADLLNSHFLADRASGIVDNIKTAYTPLMPEYINRWQVNTFPGYTPPGWNLVQSMDKWNENMTDLKNFMIYRPAGLRNAVRYYFGPALADFNLTVNVSDKNRGYVKVNSIDIAPSTPGISANPYPWTGIYFQTVPITVVAIAKGGNHFVRWEGPSGFTSTDSTLTFTSTSSALSYKAVFEIDPELVALTLSDGQLSPSFVSTTFAYKTAISSTVQAITVTPTMSAATSKIEVSVNDGAYAVVTNNVATSALTMDPGYNFIRIKVTGTDGVTTKTYTIVVYRPMSAPGNALSFDGIDDHVTIGDNSLGNFRQDAFTIEMNIRTTKKTGSGSVLNKRNVCNVTSYFDMIIADGKLKFVSCSNTAGLNYNSIVGTTPVADGKWHHIAVTRSGTLISLYVDGNLDIAFTASGIADIDNTINPDPIKIGNSICGDKYNGSIDELRIWNVARTAQQIADAMLVEVPATSTGLIAYYSFDEGKPSLSNVTFNALYGKTENGHDGTLTNFALTGGVSNWVESYAMVVPVLTSATNITSTGFTANWTSPVTGTASNYILEIALAPDFPFVYLFYDVTGNSKVVSLGPGTYYYRLRANKSSVDGQGRFSKSASVTTPSSNANLSGLAISQGTLSPGFSILVTSYAASIGSLVESVQVTPTTIAVGATLQIKLNNGSYASISSGNASAPLAMDPGVNIIYIKVLAQDGSTEKTYTITVTKSFSPPGNALNFSGSKTDINEEEYVQINKKIDSPSFTLEAWILTSENSMTGSQGFASTALFNADKGGTANDFTMGILNNKITFFDGNANQTTNGETNVVDGRWHHVAVVRDAGISLKIYVDGKLDKENSSGAGTIALNENSYIALGGNPGYAPNAFHGALDEVRIWNTARTATELQQNRFGPISPSSPDLKAYYNFDVSTNDPATTLTDLTGNGNSGILTNFNPVAKGWTESYAMVVPIPAGPSAISATEFTANWSAPAVGTVERYLLDVSTSETFVAGSFLPGFHGLQVIGTSQKVTLPSTPSGREMAGTDYYYRVRADRTAVSGQGAFSATITILSSALPVNLIAFTGKRLENANLLEWKVTDEKQFGGYQIERSFDGKNFSMIGEVKAVANGQATTTQYQYHDELVSVTNSMVNLFYYRLRMVDLDGSFAMSRIVAIENDAARSGIGSFYPNPVVNKTAFVNITLDQPDSWETHIVNAAGVSVSLGRLDLRKGVNKVHFNLHGSLPGVHLIKFDNGIQQIVRKIVVE